MYNYHTHTTHTHTVAVMRKFSHPHIIKLFGVMTDNSATYIIMELAPYGQVSSTYHPKTYLDLCLYDKCTMYVYSTESCHYDLVVPIELLV